jgi:ABC-2 type transport system ATP-binding protein
MVIETKNLVKRYSTGLVAVKGINLKVKQGEVFGLLGPNGAGKTTTLMMLATLLQPTSGTATIDGADISKSPDEVRRKIGVVFQEPSSDDLLTGYENLRLHALMYGIDRKIRKKRIFDVLKMVDLLDRKDEIVKTYSGGMRRRLEIARGLLHHPKVLFLDEPTLGLDPAAREQAWKYIQKLVQTEKITVIITTHYMDEADKLCDRIAIIDLGKIVALDSPKNLKKNLGGDVIKLKSLNPNISAVKRLKFVNDVKVVDGTVQITLKNASMHLQQILNSVGKVSSVEIHSPTLDDVFMHYAGREFKEEEGSAEGGFAERMMAYRSKGK